jgi:hypothetical protein
VLPEDVSGGSGLADQVRSWFTGAATFGALQYGDT